MTTETPSRASNPATHPGSSRGSSARSGRWCRAEDALAKDGPAREAATAIAGASWDTVADSAQAAEQPGRGGGPDLAGLLASLAAVCDRLGPALASFVASLGSDAPGRRADEVGPPGGRADGPGAAIPPAPEVPGARPPSQRRRRRRRR